MGAQTDARIRLSVDTSQAQNDLRLIDRQLDELGSDSQRIDLGGDLGIKELVDSQKRLIESMNNFVTQSAASTQRLASQMEQVSKQIDKAMHRDAQDIYQKKLKELEAQKKMLEAQLQRPQTSGGGGGSSGGGGGGGSQGGSSTPSSGNGFWSRQFNPNNPVGLLGRLKTMTGSMTKMATALSVGRAVYGYVSQGAQQESSLKQTAYNVYNRTGYYGSDFSQARPNAFATGSPYGYGSQETMNFQGQYMSKAGYTTMDNLRSDTQSLMAVSKAYGMDLNNTGRVAGRFVQTGTFQSGEQQRFANMLATAINEAGMTGRESEQLDVLEQINGTLERNAVTVSAAAMGNTLGLYSTLANSNAALKGERGADVVSTINDAITGGGDSMDLLLGWGTKYKGIEGRWALEEAKAKGVSDPENMKQIIDFWESWSGQSIDSAAGKLMLKNQFGLNPDEINELVKNADALRNGTYGEAMSEALGNGEGLGDINEKLENYNNSEVATEEQYKLAKENAQEAVGDAANTALSPFRKWFSGLSTGWQATLGVGGAAAGSYGMAKAGQWGLSKILEAFKGATGGTESAAAAASGVDDAARAAASSADDVARAAAGSADDTARAAASSLDDAARAAAGSLDDAAGAMDDVARAAAGSLDDAVAGSSKFVAGLGKVGKVLGVIGTVAEVVSTGMDVAEDLKKDDTRGAASDIGGGVGSLAGGWGGAAAGAAAGAAIGSIVPGIGTAIGGAVGGIIGGVGGALGGGKAGELLGEGVYDLATGGDDYGFSADQHQQIEAHYKKVKELYESKGNNEAQKYTKNTVVPYLKSIGVSKTVTDKYNIDVGKPDFMIDYENGVFGRSASAMLDSVPVTTQTVQPSGDISVNPYNMPTSHATGNDYVPYDNYPAMLHKGEAVLTANEARDWRSGSGSYSRTTTTSTEVLQKYDDMLDKEADLLDRREDLYEKYADETNGSVTVNTTENGKVESNNLREAKDSSILDKLADLFHLNIGSGFGSSGGGGGSFGGGRTGSFGGGRTSGGGGSWSGGAGDMNGSYSNGDQGQSAVYDAATGGGVDSNASLAAFTSNMIHGHEGNYKSINWNDNGAVSIGKIQWHGGRAKSLLQQIRDADPNGFNSIISQYGAQQLATDLSSSDNWGSYTVTKGSAIGNAMQALLGSDVGRQIQDQQMVADIQTYINKGQKLGLSDPKALAFYSDMVNQFGSYSDLINKTVVGEAVANGGSLDAIYQAAMNHVPAKYQKRRTSIYNELLGADFSTIAGLNGNNGANVPQSAQEAATGTPTGNVSDGTQIAPTQLYQDKAVGVDYVPYDGYPIRAHKGETLLTAAEGKEYRERGVADVFSTLNQPTTDGANVPQSSNTAGDFNGVLRIMLGGAVQGMTPDNQNQIVAALIQQIRMGGGNNVLGQLATALQRVPH